MPVHKFGGIDFRRNDSQKDKEVVRVVGCNCCRLAVWEHYQLQRPLGRGIREEAENAASTTYFKAKMKFAAEQNEGIFYELSTVDCCLWIRYSSGL